MAAFLLAFREAFEAVLVISIIISVLQKAGKANLYAPVAAGTVAGILGSILTAVAFQYVAGGFAGSQEAWFEGVFMLAAAGLLTTMLLWMSTQGASLNLTIRSQVEQRYGNNQVWSLFLLASVAVLREGVELVLFLGALSAGSEFSLWSGLTGILGAVVLGMLIYRGTVALNLRQFFTWMGALIILIAAGLVAHGVHELNEVGVIPVVVEHVWNLSTVLDETAGFGLLLKSLFGYNADPSLTEVIAWVAYLVPTGYVYLIRTQFIRRGGLPAAAGNGRVTVG